MKCNKCKKNNPEGSKFCSSCGANLSEKTSFEHQELMDKIIDHLEFIGYEIDKPIELEDGKHMQVIAINKNRSNLIITFNASGLVTFVSNYSINQDKVTKKWLDALECVNKMNLVASVCTYCFNESKDALVCCSWYPSEYSKKTFSFFLDIYEADIKARFNSSGIMDFA